MIRHWLPPLGHLLICYLETGSRLGPLELVYPLTTRDGRNEAIQGLHLGTTGIYSLEEIIKSEEGCLTESLPIPIWLVHTCSSVGQLLMFW
jgi:hypothetical protein